MEVEPCREEAAMWRPDIHFTERGVLKGVNFTLMVRRQMLGFLGVGALMIASALVVLQDGRP